MPGQAIDRASLVNIEDLKKFYNLYLAFSKHCIATNVAVMINVNDKPSKLYCIVLVSPMLNGGGGGGNQI